MASAMTRSWKLQEFTAHKTNVNCLALGHKSGRVLVTGGDDKKVNLWAVGKERCIMSLSGHTTPVDCVKFGQNEDFVCAGSQTGAIKIWDLEHAKLLRTLTGHKAGIRCMEFHPYGELLTSGSADTGIKLWDTKRKGCIFTYKGHDEAVNSVRFSPDGQWIASAGEEGTIKLWDLRTGRQLKEFTEHKRSVTVIEFHPHEFLLASGSVDRTVHFWDLESFQLVSATEQNIVPIRCLKFSTDGQCLFTGCQDVLRVHCWEPARTLDTVSTGWGKIHDFAIAASQLIGASSSGSVVSVYVCDTKKIKPFGNVSQFLHGNPTRKSFSTKSPGKKATINVKTIEEDKSGTDPEDDVTTAEILNVTDYRDVFQPHRSLNRTPPLEPEAFPAPHDVLDPTQPQIIQNLSTSMSSLSTIGTLDNDEDLSPTSSSISQPPSLSMTKPVPVRVNPIKSSPPLQRHTFTSTSQIKANLQQANNASKTGKNLAQVPPMKQSIMPVMGKKSNHPMGPQRSNSTLTSRVAPMAAVTPVMGDGKSKSRAPSPDSPKHFLKRQTSCRNGDVYENDFPVQINTSIRHSPSDPALNRPNTGQSRTSTTNLINSGGTLSARNSSGGKKNNRAQVAPNPKVEIRQVRPVRSVEDTEKSDFVPIAPDKGVGLDPSDFLPNSYGSDTRMRCSQGVPEMSEAEAINSIMGGHNCMMTVMTNRNRALQVIDTLLHNKGVKAAIDSAVDMNDLSIVVDVLGMLNINSTIWNLDMCNSLLPQIAELLQSKYEMYVTVGSTALKLILRNFAPMIKSNVEAPLHTIGVDVSREERYEKSLSCYKILETIHPLIQKKQGIIGPMGASFRELNVLMNSLL